MKEFIKKHKFGITAVIISMIAAILFCLSKRDFHIDESLTFALSNAEGGWVNYETYGKYSCSIWHGYEVKDPFNYKNVFTNQYWDVHPPLYYCLIHTLMSFFPNRFSIWFGLIINLVFYLFNLIIIYILLNKYTKNDLLSALGVLFYGLNKNVLNCVIFIRMYMLSSFFVLCFLAFALRIIDKEGNEYINLLLLLLTVIDGGLTHYQFYMIIASLSLCVAIYLIFKKRWFDLISSFICVVCAGLLNVFVIFKGTQYHLTVNGNGTHVGTAINNLESLSISSDRLSYFISNSFSGYFGLILSIVLLVVLLVLSIKNKRKDLEVPLVLISSYLLGFVVIMKTSSFLSNRYLIPVEIIGIISIFLSIYYLFKDKLDTKKLSIIFTILILINIDFSQVINNINNKPSWEFAKEHKDYKAYIITEEGDNPSEINVLFTNLMWYTEIDITQMSKGLEFTDKENLVLYLDKDLDLDEMMDYVKSQYSGNRQMNIEKVDIDIEAYYIYTITFE